MSWGEKTSGGGGKKEPWKKKLLKDQWVDHGWANERSGDIGVVTKLFKTLQGETPP